MFLFIIMIFVEAVWTVLNLFFSFFDGFGRNQARTLTDFANKKISP